jgi:hypothetical protein
MKKIEVSPEFHLKTKDLQSVLTGLLIMTAGTLATAVIDALITYLSSLSLRDLSIGEYPALIYLVPIITAVLNTLRKYVQENRYAN